MNWFTSDTHFGHSRVIEFCNRPFKNAQEMDEGIIQRWNSVVNNIDQVFHLGDFSFCGAIRTKDILSRLNGRKVLIRGNHDQFKTEKYIRLGFQEVLPSMKYKEFLLSHFPYKGEEIDDRVFTEQFEDNGGWLLHGHVHCSWKIKKKMINVGVDQWNFYPVSENILMDICNRIKDAHI